MAEILGVKNQGVFELYSPLPNQGEAALQFILRLYDKFEQVWLKLIKPTTTGSTKITKVLAG